nr:hypothetical protein [Tanacetum cinerariifolium]
MKYQMRTNPLPRLGEESLEDAVLAKSTSQPKPTYEAAASLSEFKLTKILMDKMDEHKSYLRADYKRELYDAMVKSYNTETDLFETYGEIFTLKRNRDDKDKDQDPSAGSERWTKRRKSSRDAESSWDLKSKESINIAHEENPTTTFDELMDTPIDFFAFVMNQLNITNLTQELLVGPTFNLLKGTCKSRKELEYHFEECYKATTERLEWHNPKGKQYLFDLHKPLPLISNHRGRHVIPFDYFINNDLEYLKGGSLSRKYSASITKTKDATYEVQWIEDMIMKWYDYGHLDKIEVPREDQQLYKFKEGDFLRLHLQDIEDISIVIQRRVEYLKLGVKSYQKNLNLNKPDTFRQDLRKRTTFIAYSDPQGVVYTDQNNKNKLMHTDELHKFSDGMLNYVRTALHDITSGIRMEYLPKKKWSRLDKRRARVMIQDIDNQLRDKRLIRSLEKFIGGREYRENLRLLERTI